MTEPRLLLSGLRGPALLARLLDEFPPGAKGLWLVPSSLSRTRIAAELAHRGGGVSRATVWTWDRLWASVRERRGEGPTLAPPAALGAVLREAIVRARRDGLLSALGDSPRMPGFRRRLRARIALWTRSGRDPESPMSGASEIDLAMRAIFARYRRILARLAIEDDAGFAIWAGRTLRDDPPPGLDRPRRVVVFEPPSDRPVFLALDGLNRRGRSASGWRRTRRGACRPASWRWGSRSRPSMTTTGPRPEGLSHLSRSLFQDDAEASDVIDGVSFLLGAPGGDGHAVVVARRVLDLRDSGASLDDVLVILPRLDDEARVLVDTLKNWGIAASADIPRRLATEPAVSALRRALRLPIAWDADEAVRLLKNGRIRPDWPEARPSMALATAATVLRESRVYRGRDAILLAVRRDARPPEGDGEGEDERSVSRLRKSRRASAALPLIERLLSRLNAAAQAGIWADQSRVALALADELGLGDDPAIEALFQAIDDHGAILDRLGRGRAELSWEAFVREIDRLVHEAGMPPEIAPAVGVRVVTRDEARGVSARHVLIADMGEGTYPSRSALDGDDEEERDTAYAREMSRFRQLVDIASESLTLVYPTTDEKGQTLLTAGFLDDVVRAFSAAAIAGATRRRDRLDPILPEELAGDPAEARVRAVDLACNHGDLSALEDLARNDAHRDILDGTARALRIAHWRGRRARFDRFDGSLSDPAILDRLARDFAPERRAFSPTQLEDLALCPFKFYQKVVLKLRPVEDRRELEDDHATRGTLLHRALEMLHARLRDMPSEDGASLSDRVERGIETTFDETLDGERAPSSEVERGLRAIEVERLRRSARRYSRQFRSYAEGVGRDATSEHLEVPFGMATDGPPPLAIGTGNGHILVSGVIDRIDVVDVDGVGYFRVIDYKTGAVPEPKGIASGLDLQLPIYALAARRVLFAEGDLVSLDAGYWGLKNKGFKASKSMTSLDGKSRDLEAEWEAFVARFEVYLIDLVGRLRAGDFPVHPRKQDCERFCDYRLVCRIGQTRKGAKRWPESPTLGVES